MSITLRETHRGLSRGSNYYFVVDGDRLVHISQYAVSSLRVYGDIVEYTVDIEKLRNKEIVEVVATNSGILCNIFVYSAEDILFGRPREVRPLSYLNGLEFTYLTHGERRFLEMDWKLYYVPMIEEFLKMSVSLRSYSQGKSRIGLTDLLSCQFWGGLSGGGMIGYPLSFLIPYSYDARARSLEALTKEIHQLWVAMWLVAELAREGCLESVILSFGQDSYYPVALFNCRGKAYSLWYEFDMNPHTMCRGMLWSRGASPELREFYSRTVAVLRGKGLGRAPLRPDIAILQGGVSCDDLAKGFRVEAIIECKNSEYGYWSREVYVQVMPYKEIFKPSATVIVSLKEVPPHVKAQLNRQGITVIDKVYPRGEGERELSELIERLCT